MNFSSTNFPSGMTELGSYNTYSYSSVPPANNKLNQYFYLPALGCTYIDNGGYMRHTEPIGAAVAYWSSSAISGSLGTIGLPRAYCFYMKKGQTRFLASVFVRNSWFAVSSFE